MYLYYDGLAGYAAEKDMYKLLEIVKECEFVYNVRLVFCEDVYNLTDKQYYAIFKEA